MPSTFYPPNAASLQVGVSMFFQEVDGDVWWTVNAFYDGSNWQRVNTGIGAWGLQINLVSNMIWESYKACTFWHAQAAANPIGSWATVGGWELVYSFSEHRNATTGGAGWELDGFGAVDHHGYGRVQHAKIDNVTYSGILVNQFLDFSGRDTTSAPSWRVGIENNGTTDKFAVARGAGGAWAGWVELLSLNPDAVLFIKNGTAPASNPSGGVYLYAEDGALKARSPSGTITTIAPA